MARPGVDGPAIGGHVLVDQLGRVAAAGVAVSLFGWSILSGMRPPSVPASAIAVPGPYTTIVEVADERLGADVVTRGVIDVEGPEQWVVQYSTFDGVSWTNAGVVRRTRGRVVRTDGDAAARETVLGPRDGTVPDDLPPLALFRPSDAWAVLGAEPVPVAPRILGGASFEVGDWRIDFDESFAPVSAVTRHGHGPRRRVRVVEFHRG